MTNIRKPKKYENIWTKTIAVLLLIALCIGSLGVRFKVFKMYDAGVFDSKDNYFKTSNALYHAQGYAIDIEKSYVNNPDSLASYLNQNFAFTIYQTDSDGVYQPVSSSEVKSVDRKTVEVLADSGTIRQGAGTDKDAVGKVKKGDTINNQLVDGYIECEILKIHENI